MTGYGLAVERALNPASLLFKSIIVPVAVKF
jgi:hypothetical protein